MKKSIQELLRFSNKSLLKQNLPKKVSIYFHDIDEDELVAIKMKNKKEVICLILRQ